MARFVPLPANYQICTACLVKGPELTRYMYYYKERPEAPLVGSSMYQGLVVLPKERNMDRGQQESGIERLEGVLILQ